ncbi:MAG: osmotically inducible protein OsmC [Bdellovibrio sp. CG10_big_fil_rev_8_21_14_0_10_47_8]|nr:MAG: osmotically inducible protein OsmC [Bdellovibrio sp. CG10_big_fil_rev_8_21_14_0_10_47_8]
MVKSKILYQGQKHCELIHEPSQSKIETDAPKDNQGKGERFSPTDLMGAALGSCILTTMAIVGERDGIDLRGSQASVEKVMTDAPRRIQSLRVDIVLPAHLSPDQRRKMEEVAKHCPVKRSLHPDVETPMTFIYQEI